MFDWSASLQKRARKIARECGLVGLTLIKNGKKAQVKYRKAEGSKVISQETVMLKHEWIQSNEDDIYTRFRNISKLMGENGHNLKAAAVIAEGKAPKKGKDWAHILDSFKDQKINFGTAISEATFNKQYLPPCEMVVDVMS